MKKQILAITFLLSTLPGQAKFSNEKSEDLYGQFQQNIFNMENITASTLMSGPCYQSDKWGVPNGINYSVILLYPYDGNIYLYSRMAYYLTDQSYKESYQKLSVAEAILRFVDLSRHPVNNPHKVAGKIVEDGSIKWIYEVTAYSMVQKNAGEFIVLYGTDNFAHALSYCEMKVHSNE